MSSTNSTVSDSSQLEQVLGYEFRQKELLDRALTHSSLSHERPDDPVVHNEQLEFLGDAVLGFVVSRELVARFASYSEGQLSKMKAQLVSAAHLHNVATRLQLGGYLHLGRSEERSGGRSKRTLLADAMEALIAAIYLDAGLDVASTVITRLVLGDALEGGIEEFPFADYKSALQEYVQSLGIGQARYSVLQERGPEHRKTFVVEVSVGARHSASAEGSTKKTAEQQAAQTMLLTLREYANRLAGPQPASSAAVAAAPAEAASPNEPADGAGVAEQAGRKSGAHTEDGNTDENRESS